MSKIRLKLRVASRQLQRCLEFFGRSLIRVHLHMGFADLKMGGSKGWIHLQHFVALRDRALIQTRHQERVCDISTDHEGKWVESFGLLHFLDSFIVPTQVAEM